MREVTIDHTPKQDFFSNNCKNSSAVALTRDFDFKFFGLLMANCNSMMGYLIIKKISMLQFMQLYAPSHTASDNVVPCERKVYVHQKEGSETPDFLDL